MIWLLAAVLPGVLVQGFNPCLTEDHFTPDAWISTWNSTCSEAADNFDGAAADFEPSLDTCFVKFDKLGNQTPAKMLMTIAATCCSDIVSICQPYSLNPCHDPSSFQPGAILSASNASCGEILMTTPGFNTSLEACSAANPDVEGQHMAAMLEDFAPSCCTDSVSMCSPYVSNPCQNPDDFDRSALTAEMQGNEPVRCGLAALLLPFGEPGAPSKETCLAMSSYGISNAALLSVAAMAPCCSGPPACREYLFNPCADPAAFDPAVVPPAATLACSVYASVVEPFEPSEETCYEIVPSAENPAMSMPRSSLLTYMSECCSEGGDICAAYMKNWCADPAAYKPDAVIWGTPCSAARGSLPLFQPTAETCAERVTIFGQNTTRQAALSFFARPCCGATPSVCDAFRATPVFDVFAPIEPAPTPAPETEPTDVSSAAGCGLLRLLTIAGLGLAGAAAAALHE